MSLALTAAVPSDTSPGQHERDQRFISALDRLLSQSGITLPASDLVALAEGPGGLMQGDSISRLLRASVPRQTAEIVAKTINAARDLTSWWPAERARVQAPADLAAIAQPLFGRSPQEQLYIAIVDGRNGLLDLRHVYTGTATGTSVRIGELLRPVLEAHGVGFAAVHNHPSGDPEPSDEDLRLTSELLAAARLLDIEFLDHLVIGHGRWVSIRSKQPSIWGGEPH
ncbi:MAG: JAB domain-containing protein [Candidatus Limnocylindrus sp.]